jgi:hypothetical protein
MQAAKFGHDYGRVTKVCFLYNGENAAKLVNPSFDADR